MFRFVSSNAAQSLRPALVQKLRNNASVIVSPSLQNPQAVNSHGTNYNLPPTFRRYNSSVAPTAQAEAFLQTAKDPLIKDVVENELNAKLNYFTEQMHLLNQYKTLKDREGQRAFHSTISNILNAFKDSELRETITPTILIRYINALNYSIYHNRTNRLTGSKNRDKDQYRNSNFMNEVSLKQALLDLSGLILKGEFNTILRGDGIRGFFNAMNQFQFYDEIIDVWEQGVNDNKLANMYLDAKVLSTVLPIAYKVNRFSYEEVLHIYELNTKDTKELDKELLCSMGKVSISAQDYTRGLDALEALLKAYEVCKNPQKKHEIQVGLGDLHLAFIGSCKDITIAKHFFDKVIQYDLPYPVKLKVPHVQSLLQNCFESKETLESIVYFWKATISHYSHDTRSIEMNSRYAILNNAFFKIFFQLMPELDANSFNQLKQLISTYSDIKPIDETFMNTLITNYPWGDKKVFEQLLENYELHNIKRTQVSYRVCLKKCGEIPGYSNEELLSKWNESLLNLDRQSFNYIPNADWASIRDASINSRFDDRKDIYWSIVSKYKDYFQDERTAIRTIKTWERVDANKPILIQIAEGTYPSDITVPPLQHLKANISFKDVFKSASK